MKTCLTWEYPRLSFVELLCGLIYSFTHLFFCTFAETDDEIAVQRAASRAVINEQLERMLLDYGNSVLRLAYSYLHNMPDAEEVLQDTLIQFLKTEPVLATKEHEKAWLLRVAANLSKNRIKYNTIRQADELMEELIVAERNDLSFVWDAVKALPEKYREVIHLFYHEGYQTAQIAKILGMKEATVRSNLARGREKLKTVLKEAYDFG